ncbi:MAG: DUF896 domain-containing protein [Oscillospiraceae bacterium]|nr:DUF896 domain-containing protein [Oscillospiraceae bacterium]
MEKSKVDRINELARKSKSVGLTPEEKEEQAQLRAEYIADFRRSTIEILDNTYLQRPDGTKEKLKPKS